MTSEAQASASQTSLCRGGRGTFFKCFNFMYDCYRESICDTACVWQPEDNFWEHRSLLPTTGSRDWGQVVRLTRWRLSHTVLPPLHKEELLSATPAISMAMSGTVVYTCDLSSQEGQEDQELVSRVVAPRPDWTTWDPVLKAWHTWVSKRPLSMYLRMSAPLPIKQNPPILTWIEGNTSKIILSLCMAVTCYTDTWY